MATEFRKLQRYDRTKRALDAGVAGFGLILLSPVMVIVACLVRAKLGAPILFRQQRPGKDERIFTLIKFRTMLDPDPNRGLESDASRLTNFGRRLRSTSLDELPTLWNVVRGDMSLVGPRPLLPEYLPQYSKEQARRHEVRPGVTGLAQVNGRNLVAWPERLAMDVEYVKTRSAKVDFGIVLATFKTVFSRRGVSAEGEATMDKFCGEAVTYSSGGQR